LTRDLLKTVKKSRQYIKFIKMKKLIFSSLCGIAFIFLMSFTQREVSTRSKILQEQSRSTKPGAKKIYVSISFSYHGCNYILDLNINSDWSGGEGWLSKDCGHGSSTIHFTYGQVFHMARFTSTSDFVWDTALTPDEDQAWLDNFLVEANDAIEDAGY
jgi:hypothetical protein